MLLCYPVSDDQLINYVYIVSVWKIGIQLGALERRAVEQRVKRLMDDGEDNWRRVRELRDGGISGGCGSGGATSCLESFVNDLKAFVVKGEGVSLISSL